MSGQLLTHFYAWMLLLTIAASCNAQRSRTLPVRDTIVHKAGHARIVKTQGSNEYATISCALQDKAGNLWFGTSGEGVYRYDGKTFTTFSE